MDELMTIPLSLKYIKCEYCGALINDTILEKYEHVGECTAAPLSAKLIAYNSMYSHFAMRIFKVINNPNPNENKTE